MIKYEIQSGSINDIKFGNTTEKQNNHGMSKIKILTKGNLFKIEN